MSISLTRSPSVNSNENNSSNQRRVAWSKLHDRNLSTSQKNRIVNAMGPHRFPDTPSSHTSRRLGGDASSFENMNLTNPDLMNRGLTKDFLTLACYNAIATGQIGLLKSIYKTGEAPQVDKQGNTPLHIAARCGQLRSLRWLLQYSCTPVQAKNCRGETPLHVAGLHGNLKCLEALLESQKDNVYHVVSDRDNMGMTVLHHATIGNRDTTVEWLAEAFGKDLCLVKSVDGVLAIHLAAAAGNKYCTQVLAEVCRQTVNVRDMFGATAAFYAAQEGHLPCLEYLVEEACSHLGIVACEGMTAVLTAAEGGHLDVLQYIIMKQGHSVLLESTNDGATVFHYASGNGHYQILKYLLDLPNTSNLLRLCDTNDRSPAHDAAENGHVDCLKLIVDAGMSVYQPDKDGETPLSLALKCGNPKCAMFAKVVSETAIDKNSLKEMKKKMGSKFPQISNILNIQALSRSDAKSFKNGKCTEWNGAIPNNLLQKKKMVGNMDTIENESLSLKSEGIYVWPSWQRSLSSRRTNRPASRGIFRGEFILLRSSPPGTLSLKNRKLSVPNRNGHLYAQRNRPCPISLPLQKHEYPTHINQMDVEDDINADDIERFFKQPLDVIPEYDNMDAKPHLYQVQEEDEDSSHELDEDAEDHSMSYPYTTQTLDRHFGLKEAQTSFSVWDRRPYRRARPLCSSSLIDYSSDESGISTESGISSHSDEDKNGYNPSSSDESGTSKRFSDSSDSAVKDFYFISSDDEDIKLTKRKKSEFLAEIIETNVEVKAKEPPSPKLPTPDEVEFFSMSEGTDDVHSDHDHIKPNQTKPLKPSKRPTKNTHRKRNVSSSDEEGLDTLSSSFIGLARNRNNSNASESSQSTVSAPKPTIEVSPPKDIIAAKPIVTESLASVLQRSMMVTGDLKHSLRSNSMKDNTCKTVFNSASLSRDSKKKTSPRPSCKTSPPPPIPTSLPPSLRTEVQRCTLPKPILQNQQLNTEVSRKGSFNSCIDIKPKSEKIQRSQSVAGYDLHEQSRTTQCSKLMVEHQTPKKSNIFSQRGSIDVSLVTEVHNRIGSENNSDEETYSVPKTASKIRALQDVLMKQSLPFANPFLFKENRTNNTETSPPCTKEESLKTSTKLVVESTVFPPVPPPPPPPPTTLPKVKKAEPSYTKCVSYATTTKIQTGKDNCELDDATRTRIASIKCMLERASSLDEPDVSSNSKTINPNSHETTGGTT